MKIAFVWNPDLWVNRCHYVMEVFVHMLEEKSVTVLSVGDLDGVYPSSFDVVILESTSISIERYCFPRDLVDSYNAFIRNAKRLVMYVHDIHDSTWIDGISGFSRFIKQNGIQTLITKCERNQEFELLAEMLSDHEFVHMLDVHSLPLDFQAPVRDRSDKLFDIFMFGNFQPWQGYVFRKRVHDLVLKLPAKVFHQEVGGSFSRDQFSNVLLGKDLIRLISHSYLTLCTRTTYDYFVLKYVEAAAAGTVILGDIPSDAKNLLSSDNFVHIDESMSDELIASTISESLKSKEDLYMRGQALRRRFSRKFSMEKHVDDIVSFIERTDGDFGALQ